MPRLEPDVSPALAPPQPRGWRPAAADRAGPLPADGVPNVLSLRAVAAEVRILLVADGETSFVPSARPSLSRVAAALGDGPPDAPRYARLAVRRVHRAAPEASGADELGFHFTAARLAGVDEVWLFAYAGGDALAGLRPAERDVLERFVAGGGGLLRADATPPSPADGAPLRWPHPVFSGPRGPACIDRSGRLRARDEHATGGGRVLASGADGWLDGDLDARRTRTHGSLSDTLAFFRSCALWLAPRARQDRLRQAATLLVLEDPVVRALLPGALARPGIEVIHALGAHGLDALGRVAPAPHAERFVADLLAPVLPASPRRGPAELPAHEDEALAAERYADAWLVNAAYGGALIELARAVRTARGDRRFLAELAGRSDDVAREGAARAFSQAQVYVGRCLEGLLSPSSASDLT